MNMEITQILISLLGLCCTVLGWFARQLYAATQNLRTDLSALQTQIASDYIRYDRLQDAIKPIMDSLHEIKQTLNSKADK